MMYWFLQGKMCSERDVFYHSSAPQSFAQGVACDRHQVIVVIVLPSPLENCYSLQQVWVDWAIDACVQTVMDSLLCKLPHPINATSVHQQRATISSPFLQTKDSPYCGYKNSEVLWFLETTLGSMVRHLTQDMSFGLHCLCTRDSPTRSNKKVWYVIWKSSKRSNKKVRDVIWKSSKRSNEKVLDVKKKNSKRSSKSVLDVAWKSSKRSSKKVWDVLSKKRAVA